MQRLFPGLSAVAFDLDDTLFDREAAVRSLLRAWLGEVPTVTMREILHRDGRGHSPREPFFDWLESSFPDLGGNLWLRFRAEIPNHLVGDPAARPLLNKITDAGMTPGLLTNGGTVLQMEKLVAAGLGDFFQPQQSLVSEAMGWEKPHPQAFCALATALSQPPERILFIGDHAETDIVGAKNAGLRTCWLRRRDPGGVLEQADLVVDSLEEIIPFLFPAHEL